MRILKNAENMIVVHRGKDAPFCGDVSVCDMVRVLHKQEQYVWWLQPAGMGIDAQRAVLRVEGKYYCLTLRVMRSIWKHVKVHKSFCNYEVGIHGGYKLRIPTKLLKDKLKSYKRDTVSMICI
jgi:hypothetical protein